MTTTTTVRIRIGRRVVDHMDGTQAWANVRGGMGDTDPSGYCSAADLSLVRKIAAAPNHKDRSCTVELTVPEAEALLGYVGAMEAGAADNTWDADGRADLAAARGTLRWLAKAGITDHLS